MSAATANACPRCQKPVAPGMKFCSSCGLDISGVWGDDAALVGTVAVDVESRVDELGQLLGEATLGEYDIYGELGRGGMAAVYLALDLALNRKVAIKTMLPELVVKEGMVQRFKREAQTAAALSHPHIIQIFTVRESRQLVYFVMKFIEGRSLESVITDKGQVPIEMAQVLLNQVGTALAYAHRKGVIHRDIKPANIMIDEDGWAIVTDFGIAKVQEAQNLTATGTAIGTPHYMSPEQFHNKTITGSSDQYSLGIVAYEMLTGKKPFDGATYAEIITQHLFEPVPDIRQLRSDLPDNVVEVVNRMMAKEPGQRFADLDAAMHALGAPATKKEGDVIRTQMISLAKSGAQKRLRMSVPMSPIPLGKTRARQVAPTAIERRPPVKKSRAGLWTALSVVGILALGGGSYAVLKFGASSSTPPAATIEQQSRPAPVVPTPLAERQGVATDSTPSVATNAPADPNAVRADSIRRAREDSIRITRAAERAAEQRLRQQQGAGARQAQTKIAPPPAPARGRSTGLATLRLILSPPASVFIDGVSKGQQSRIAEEMVPGTHTVRIERDGFATKDTVVTLGTGQIATVRIQLSQRP